MGSYTNVNTARYPAYLESAHQTLLNLTRTRVSTDSAITPTAGRVDIEMDDLFFDTGSVIGNYPALFDIYGKFMAGLDVSVLYSQIINDTTDGSIAKDLISNKATLINSEIANSFIRFDSGIDDINSVMSSVYLTGSALISANKEKLISRFESEIKYKLLPTAISRWSTHLSWNKAVINQYMEIIKLYYKLKVEVINTNTELNARNTLWPLDLLEFERSVVGLLTGATSSSTSGKTNEPSDLMGAVGGALSGASAGFMVGGPVGAIVGGIIGVAASFF